MSGHVLLTLPPRVAAKWRAGDVAVARRPVRHYGASDFSVILPAPNGVGWIGWAGLWPPRECADVLQEQYADVDGFEPVIDTGDTPSIGDRVWCREVGGAPVCAGVIVSVSPCDFRAVPEWDAVRSGYRSDRAMEEDIRSTYRARWYWRIEWRPLDASEVMP